MRGPSGRNKRETARRRPLRKKDRSREHPLCEARAGPTSARLQRGGRCGKKSVAASRANTRLERAQQARDCRRRPLRKKDRPREQPLCEARAGATSARLQGGGRCGKRTAPVSTPYARPGRAQRARDCREEAAAEKSPLPRAGPIRGTRGQTRASAWMHGCMDAWMHRRMEGWMVRGRERGREGGLVTD